jgi:hypothetical protein
MEQIHYTTLKSRLGREPVYTFGRRLKKLRFSSSSGGECAVDIKKEELYGSCAKSRLSDFLSAFYTDKDSKQRNSESGAVRSMMDWDNWTQIYKEGKEVGHIERSDEGLMVILQKSWFDTESQ